MMDRRRYLYCHLGSLLLATLSSWVLPALATPLASDASVRDILERHCYQCHGPEKQKGKVRLDTLSTDLVADRAAAETWHDALDSIQLGEMPPEDEPGLSRDERTQLVGWIEHRLEQAHLAAAGSAPTGVVMRRLNRAEYQYTMTDLLGFEMDYADKLPPDPHSTDGFLNNGAALGLSGMQMSAYLDTARRAMEYVLVDDGAAPEREIKAFDPKFKGRTKLPPGLNQRQLGRNHYWSGSIEKMPRTGPFTLRITARAKRNDTMPIPSLKVEYGYFVAGLTVTFRDTLGELVIDSTEPQTYEISGLSEFSPQPDDTVLPEKLNGVVVLSNALHDGIAPPKPKKVKRPGDPTSKDKKKRKPHTEQVYEEDPDFPQIIIERVELVQNDYPVWPPAHHQAIVGGRDLEQAGSVRAILGEFLQRAWRRPIAEAELDQWLGYHQQMRPTFDSPIAALREILALALVSNHFLYLTEPQPADRARPLTGHELASRLSYFLWSSMPDAALHQAAGDGALDIPAQVDRLLADPRSQRFVEQFTTQWLDLEAVDRVAINPQFYQGFDNRLKALMAQESREYFGHILRSDASAMELLSSDYTFANRQLAAHYGVQGARSMQFEKVSLAGSGRGGGLLSHAAMHLAGSDGAHTHPIKRAVWIRERLLHDPPKPPPPDVPSVEQSVPNFAKLSVREQLEVHSQKESCADCHRGIDPWGIAMEEYDAIGLQRDRVAKSKRAVDATTTLPGGAEVDGLAELQEYLLAERSDQFAHALVAKMLTYALGRSLTFDDEPAVEAIADHFSESDYRLVPLIQAITSSPIFTSR